jgi:hypothetical protein
MTKTTEVPPRRGRGRPSRRRSELERLLDLTVLGPTHPELGTCWRFTGTTTPYGRIAKAQDSYAHRLGWKLLRGPIPKGKELHHRCGVYACWNPDHLQVVTHAENLTFKRKTHCKHGHPLSGDNLRIDPRTGARVCRACLRESQRRLRRKHAAIKTGIWDQDANHADPAVLQVDLAQIWKGSLMTQSWSVPIRSSGPAGCSPDLPIPMDELIEHRSDTYTGWAGSYYAARFPTAWSFITAAASMPAGTPTTS